MTRRLRWPIFTPMETEQTNLCLIDGTFELFRAYFSAPSRPSLGGMEIAASRALAKSLRALAGSGEFTHYAVAFDTRIESFRNDLFAGYKTGEGIEPALLAQFPLAERVTAELGFAVLGLVEFEADDGLATLAWEHRTRAGLTSIVIASPDKDLRQCVTEEGRTSEGCCPVVTWDRIRDVRYDERGVRDKMGISPRSVPDYLALVGDTADGIPGVPRWGARSAAQVLDRYGHIEAIPRSAAAWDLKLRGASALVEQLCSHEAEVALYKRLATLRTDVPHDYSWEDLFLTRIDEERWDRVEQLLNHAVVAPS